MSEDKIIRFPRLYKKDKMDDNKTYPIGEGTEQIPGQKGEPTPGILSAGTKEEGQDTEIVDIIGIDGEGTLTEYDNFDDLVARKGLDIYTEMMTDGQVRMAINAKRYGVISSDWGIVAATDSAEDINVADFVKASLAGCQGSVISIVFQILSALYNGYSIGEMIFYQETVGPWAGMYPLLKIKSKDPRDYEFKMDEYGNLTELLLEESSGNRVPVSLWKFLFYTYQPEFNRIYGRSDLRAIYKHYWSKDILLKFSNMYLERFGTPVRIGKYPAGQYAKRTQLMEILKSITNNTSLVLPSDFDIDFKSDKGTGSNLFAKFIDYHDEAIVKGILGQTLSSSEGRRTGSLALGKVHAETMEDSVTFLRKDMAEFVIERIIRTLVWLNFPPGTLLPTFYWQPRSGKLVMSSPDDLKTLIETGVLTLDDVNLIRQRLDLPKIEKFDESKVLLTPEDKVDVETAKIKTKEFNRYPRLAAPEHVEDHSKCNHAAVDISNYKKRELKESDMTESEQRLGGVEYYEKEKESRDKAENKLMSKISPITRKMLATTKKYFSKNVYDNDDFADAVTKFKFPNDYIKELERLSKEYMSGITANEYVKTLGEVEITEGIPDISKYNLVEPNADAAKIVDEWVATGNWKKVKAWRSSRLKELSGTMETTGEFWIAGKIDIGLLEAAQDTMLSGMLTGLSEKQVMKELSKAFLPYGSDPKLINPHRLRNIVRTNSTRAYSQARLMAIQDPQGVSLFPGIMYSAIIDNRTTDICFSFDGSIWPSHEEAPVNIPAHYMCRSTWIPAMKSDVTKIGGFSPAPDLDIVDPDFGGTKGT